MPGKNPIKILLASPTTWLVLILIGGAHFLFNFWFNPPLFYNLLASIADLAALGLWLPLALRSRRFREQLNTMPYEKTSGEILTHLKGCPDSFRLPATRSLSLIEEINREFSDQDYQIELNLLVSNLSHLTRNHKKLYARFQSFGTPEQKQHMQKLLTQQVGSVEKILTTLQAFSGNLTILAASTEKAVEATNELKYINEGLKEVIQTDL